MPTALTTARLCLSPFTEQDQADLFAYASDPRVAATVTWDAHASPAASLEFIRFISEKTNETPGRYFLPLALRERAGGKAIGSITFSQHSQIGGQIDYALGAEHWNRGLTTEAAHAVIGWAFATLPGLVRIQARCLPENSGSRRVMEKTGMRFEGISRAAMLVKGKPVDLATYALLRSDR